MTPSFTPITLEHGFRVFSILLGGCIFLWLVTHANRKIVSFFSHTKSLKENDQRLRTASKLFTSILSIAIFIIMALMILREFDIDTAPLLTSAGIVGIMLSLSAQAFLKDVIAGITILLEGQYGDGDDVRLNDVRGHVYSISLRRTILEDEDGTLHSVPHGEIKLVSVYRKKKAKKE